MLLLIYDPLIMTFGLVLTTCTSIFGLFEMVECYDHLISILRPSFSLAAKILRGPGDKAKLLERVAYF